MGGRKNQGAMLLDDVVFSVILGRGPRDPERDNPFSSVTLANAGVQFCMSPGFSAFAGMTKEGQK